jgi:hypothetical protein
MEMARQNTYGNIELPECPEGLIDSLKESQAKNLACECASAQGIEIDTEDVQTAVAFVEQWYDYDRENRCWRVSWEKCNS